MLLNFKQCQTIIENNQSFMCKTLDLEGYKVYIFDYLLSNYDHFKNPVAHDPSIEAFEMRGITFVHDHINNTFHRYLCLNKFFNLNENSDYQLENLKKYPIIRMQEKLDGSMIRFFPLPNKSVYAKTRYGIGNDQCILAMDWYNSNQNIKNFIQETFDHNLSAIFELVSPFNKIVCDYDITECQLLQLRDENTGEYLDIYTHPLVLKYKNEIKVTKSLPLMSYDELLEYKEKAENTEGMVVTNSDRLFKVKTKWYMDRFRVRSALETEDTLIKLILDGQLDDAVPLLSPDNPYRIMAYDIQNILLNHLIDLKNKSTSLFDEYLKKYNKNRKDFSINHSKSLEFSLICNQLDNDIIDDEKLMQKIKENIKHNTRRLKMAQDYLKALGFKKPKNLPYNDS